LGIPKPLATALSLAVGIPKAALRALAGAPKLGEQAPDFELEGSDGRTYKLSDFRGKQAVVIAWFPKAFTNGCTIECKSLAENGAAIRAFEVAYFMASVDPVDENAGFAREQDADFPLLCDPTKRAARAYGVLNLHDRSRRWTFYIGKDGTVLEVDKEVRPETSAQDMAAKLAKLGIPRKPSPAVQS